MIEKINVLVEKSTPNEAGEFTVTLRAIHKNEMFTQTLDNRTYTEATWTEAEYRSRSSEFAWNIRSQFE